jgi:hypothetical protein
MKTLAVHEGAFTVLRVFDCKPGESERFAKELADFTEARTRFQPGFLSSLIYLSDDACKIVEIYQWARAGDWESFCNSETGRRGGEIQAGRLPNMQFLEMVRVIGAVPPGEGEPR